MAAVQRPSIQYAWQEEVTPHTRLSWYWASSMAEVPKISLAMLVDIETEVGQKQLAYQRKKLNQL